MSLSAPNVANRGGYIVEAVRENYQDARVEKARQEGAEKLREKALEDLTEAFRAKRATLIRQAVHAHPELVEHAAARIQSYRVKERLLEHAAVMAAYQKGRFAAGNKGIRFSLFFFLLQNNKNENLLRL